MSKSKSKANCLISSGCRLCPFNLELAVREFLTSIRLKLDSVLLCKRVAKPQPRNARFGNLFFFTQMFPNNDEIEHIDRTIVVYIAA